MATPQQPELHRSNRSPADPASAKAKRPPGPSGPSGDAGEGPGPVPADNQPGHHPAEEQDKPFDRFEELARQRVAETTPDRFAPPPEPGEPADDTAEVVPPPWPPAAGAFSLGGVPIGVLVPAVSLLDAARRPGWAWDEVGESRLGWMARIALLPVLGPWRYDRGVRPRLDGAAGR